MVRKEGVIFLLALATVILLGISLATPWYGVTLYENDRFLSHRESTLWGETIRWANSTESYAWGTANAPVAQSRTYKTTAYIMFAAFAVAVLTLLWAIAALKTNKNVRGGSVFLFFTLLLAVAAPLFLAVTVVDSIHEDREYTVTRFLGSEKRPIELNNATFTSYWEWGPLLGWYLALIAFILALIAFIWII